MIPLMHSLKCILPSHLSVCNRFRSDVAGRIFAVTFLFLTICSCFKVNTSNEPFLMSKESIYISKLDFKNYNFSLEFNVTQLKPRPESNKKIVI